MDCISKRIYSERSAHDSDVLLGGIVLQDEQLVYCERLHQPIVCIIVPTYSQIPLKCISLTNLFREENLYLQRQSECFWDTSLHKALWPHRDFDCVFQSMLTGLTK